MILLSRYLHPWNEKITKWFILDNLSDKEYGSYHRLRIVYELFLNNLYAHLKQYFSYSSVTSIKYNLFLGVYT